MLNKSKLKTKLSLIYSNKFKNCIGAVVLSAVQGEQFSGLLLRDCGSADNPHHNFYDFS